MNDVFMRERINKSLEKLTVQELNILWLAKMCAVDQIEDELIERQCSEYWEKKEKQQQEATSGHTQDESTAQ